MRHRLIGLFLALATACSAGTPPSDPPAPDDGGGGGGEAQRCPDLSSTGTCARETRDNGCLDGEACGLGVASCGEAGSCCTLPFSCGVGGARPGAFRCEQDGDCASGACLAVGGRGSCLRACLPSSEGDCPDGFSCRLTAFGGERSVYSCLGGTSAAPEPGRTLCASDRDCDEGRTCRYLHGEAMVTTGPIATCLPAIPARDVGAPCFPDGWPADLRRGDVFDTPPRHCEEGGACAELCDQSGGPCTCGSPEWETNGCRRELRCTRPCTRDADCPMRWICSFPDSIDDDLLSPRDLEPRYCRRPSQRGEEWACWDESDCCRDGLQPSGTPCCEFDDGICNEPPVDVTHCRLEPAAEPGRHHSTCRVPLGRAGLGGACALDLDCESAICGPDGLCTSPCEAYVDVCGALLPGTQCCGLEVELGVGGLACVSACRASCEGARACTP